MIGRSGWIRARVCIACVAVAVAVAGCFGGGGPQAYGSIEGYVWAHATARADDGAPGGSGELVVTRSRVAPHADYVPLEGAEIVADGYHTRSGADGHFALTSMPPGVYVVFVSHERFIMGLRFEGVVVRAGFTAYLGEAQVGSFFYLIVGIDEYRENPLQYCVEDAQALRETLWRNNAYAGEAVLLTNDQADKEGIEAAIRNIGNRMNPQDYFVMTFAGHGGSRALEWNEEPDPPDDNPLEYLVAADDQTITDDELTAWIGEYIPTDYCLFVFDSCHSGGMADRAPGASAPDWMRGYRPGLSGLARDLSQYGYVVLMASADNQVSYEYPEVGHGVFTYYLCEGINTLDADSNDDGYVSAREAFAYAAPKVEDHTNGAQTPQLFASPDSRADIPIYRAGPPK